MTVIKTHCIFKYNMCRCMMKRTMIMIVKQCSQNKMASRLYEPKQQIYSAFLPFIR